MNWRYQVRVYNVTVSLDAETHNTPALVTYDGNPDAVYVLKQRLANAYGAFGHSFDPEITTATDLDYALFSTFPGDVTRLTDAPSYDPGIPQGAVT